MKESIKFTILILIGVVLMFIGLPMISKLSGLIVFWIGVIVAFIPAFIAIVK